MFVSPARPAASYSTSPQGQPSSMVTPMKDHNLTENVNDGEEEP